jgi:hypothetical protein
MEMITVIWIKCGKVPTWVGSETDYKRWWGGYKIGYCPIVQFGWVNMVCDPVTFNVNVVNHLYI